MSDDSKYDASAFLAVLDERMQSKAMPKCPFCGEDNYSTLEQVAMIPVGVNFNSPSVWQTAPCAMIVCTNCGHVDYFAIGMLGLCPNDNKEGGQNKQANANDN